MAAPVLALEVDTREAAADTNSAATARVYPAASMLRCGTVMTRQVLQRYQADKWLWSTMCAYLE